MKGGIADSRNHRRNELPFILPITPPASPKKNAMTRKAMAAAAPRVRGSEQRAQRPDDRHDRHDDRDEPGDAGHDADDDLEEEPGRDGEHHAGQEARPDRRPRLLGLTVVVHAPSLLCRGGRLPVSQSYTR